MILETFTKETPDGYYKAEVHQTEIGVEVKYYKPTGEVFRVSGGNVSAGRAVQEAREWVAGINTLYG